MGATCIPVRILADLSEGTHAGIIVPFLPLFVRQGPQKDWTYEELGSPIERHLSREKVLPKQERAFSVRHDAAARMGDPKALL